MKFNKEQIFTEEFRNFIKRIIPIEIKDSCEKFFDDYHYYSPFFAIQIVYIGTYANFNPEVDKYGAKAFQFYKIVKDWTNLKEPFKYEDYIDEILQQINDDLNSDDFNDEFDVLGDYENLEEVDLWEYTKYLQNFINISEAL